jgi:AbiV
LTTSAEASAAAYGNSRKLLEEAIMLFEKGRWARSYFLAVTSAEQFTRSVEFACESVGFELKAKRPSEGLHDFNLRRFGLLAISSHTMAIEGWNFFARMSAGKVLPKTYDRVYLETLMRSFVQVAGRKRNGALYVELEEGNLTDPESITKQNAHEMMKIVGPVVTADPEFLKLKGEPLKSYLGLRYAPMIRLGDANDARTDRELLRAVGRFLGGGSSPAPEPVA